jgi:hypothetical protein
MTTAGTWTDVATYEAEPPLAPRRFAEWLASPAGLTFDLAWDAVQWLLTQSPSRFTHPHEEDR